MLRRLTKWVGWAFFLLAAAAAITIGLAQNEVRAWRHRRRAMRRLRRWHEIRAHHEAWRRAAEALTQQRQMEENHAAQITGWEEPR